MNSSIPTAAALPLPTEQQVKAFFLAKANELRTVRKLDRIFLQCICSAWGPTAEPNVTFFATLDATNTTSGEGLSIEEAIRKFDEKNGPQGLREQARKLREQAEAMESEAQVKAGLRFRISDDTKLLIVEDNEVTTWRELVASNIDGSSLEEIECWKTELARRGEAKVGGGAAVQFTLKIAA